ncbi:MAG: hypothetical protein JWQ20_4181 [Conexibacter sp.]|nr:hypothetical protein [Conexibacter sp.]
MTRPLERGDVCFLYRSRVGVEEVRSLDDVARFFVILDPDGRGRERLLIVGRKRLPDPSRHERAWAIVAKAAERPGELGEDLGAREYETRTRGRRTQQEARPVGEGRYVLADHDGHTHLAYTLELPPEPGGDAESELGLDLDIEPEQLATAELFADLKLRPDDLPLDPLIKGRLR